MMPRQQRAYIFQAFDALKGFRELLNEKERIVVEKRELSEDDLEMLDQPIIANKGILSKSSIMMEKNIFKKKECSLRLIWKYDIYRS